MQPDITLKYLHPHRTLVQPALPEPGGNPIECGVAIMYRLRKILFISKSVFIGLANNFNLKLQRTKCSPYFQVNFRALTNDLPTVKQNTISIK